ncbi:hypothetical protein TNCV_1426711 [Trichonephila clavipes]|nr:hypothetical protein TNCV_1426711 [Trichonephila clavipes]
MLLPSSVRQEIKTSSRSGAPLSSFNTSVVGNLRLDIFELQETKLPVRLINTIIERRQVQEHGTTPLKMKRDIEDPSSELDNGVKGCTS